MCRKVNRVYHKIFSHCNIAVPNGKVLHIGRMIGMNYGKDNEVAPDEMFCMTDHTVGERGSNIDRIHYFAHSPLAEMYMMSGETNKK